MLFPAIEVEVGEKGNLFINARGSRRATPEWSVMIRPDGSGMLYMRGSELALPANRKMSRQLQSLLNVPIKRKQAKTRTLDDVSALCENLDELTAYLKSGTGQRFKIVLL